MESRGYWRGLWVMSQEEDVPRRLVSATNRPATSAARWRRLTRSTWCWRLSARSGHRSGHGPSASRRRHLPASAIPSTWRSPTARPPKYGSERTIYLADGLADIVAAHIVRLRGRGAQRWLFRGENGNPPHQNTVGYW